MMTDLHESNDENSRTINIEIPFDCFERMYKMMTRYNTQGGADFGCCESSKGNCCPRPKKPEVQEINFILKMKE